MNCVPRPSPKFLGNRIKIRTPWNFSLSVFRPYVPDNDALLLRCFELDWSRTKIERLIKDPEHLEKVKNLCRQNYKWFRESYKYTTAVDP